jgi:hypothetical protein
MVIQLHFSAAVNGAGNLGAYRLLTGKTKKGLTTFNKNVPLSSATYDPVALTVTLFTSGKLNLSQPMQVRVTASLLTDGFGRALDGNHDGQPGGDFSANLGKGGVRVLGAGASPAFTAAATPALSHHDAALEHLHHTRSTRPVVNQTTSIHHDLNVHDAALGSATAKKSQRLF